MRAVCDIPDKPRELPGEFPAPRGTYPACLEALRIDNGSVNLLQMINQARCGKSPGLGRPKEREEFPGLSNALRAIPLWHKGFQGQGFQRNHRCGGFEL